MFRIKPATRLAITIGFVSASLVWVAYGLKLIPDPNQGGREKRIAIVKTLAASTTGFAAQNRVADLERTLELTAELNKTVESVGIFGQHGYVAKSTSHADDWETEQQDENPQQASLEILANGKQWGTLQVRFANKNENTGLFGFMFPFTLIGFVSLATTFFSWIILNKSFRYLNPSKVVPKRVRSAFDTLTEGLVLIDSDCEVAHANQAFGKILDRDTETLIGEEIDDLGWGVVDDDRMSTKLPWHECIESQESVIGRILELGENENRRKFFVNSAPILGDNGDCRGAMISFDDVTTMERKKTELALMIKTLRSSRDEVERQNKQLTFLASYDPLTQCMNRRAFWIEFEELWGSVEPSQLSLLMVDVDHFKLLNDTLGHSFGDEVLKALGDTLRSTVSDQGVVCRYGGEEFVVAIPNMSIDEGMELTHVIHQAIRDMKVDGKNITASIGFSNRDFKAMDGQHLLDQADQCLYAAKHKGRNCVVRFDECPSDVMESKPENETVETEVAHSTEIPYAAVSGLLSALAFRCPATANHSTRVADLCVNLGSKLLNRRDLYRLEVAALLHDIGKVGVPDAILHKPGKLTDEEWQIMKQQEEIGLQIIRSAFASDAVPRIIEAHRAEMNNKTVDHSFNKTIATSVAIIKVCDAFDSMIHDSVYRKGKTPEMALQEIVTCTPKQFEIEVVTKLVEYVRDFGVKIRNSVQVTDQQSSIALSQESSVPHAQAANISNYIEKLQAAVESKNVEDLQSIVRELKANAVSTQMATLAVATNELEAELDNKPNPNDLELVLKLASDVMEICDETRKTILETPSIQETAQQAAAL